MGRRVLVTLESRATYGYSKNVMLAMRDFPDLELQTMVTGMHLVPELGNSIDLIRQDGFVISATVPMHGGDASRGAWSRALGQAIAGYAEAYERLQPDVILLSGDRIETFGCCIAAAYMGIPIAHIQAGDKSGHIDDSARHAIGKFAHIHLASCEDSVNRLRRMGEQEFRIFNVGAPQLDNIVDIDYRRQAIEVNGHPLDLGQPYILMVQHSVMAEMEDAGQQVAATLEACAGSGLPTYIIYPNSDLGYKQIISRIEERATGAAFTVLENVEREAYLTLLANCAVLAGNSSSGILEAPSFRIPVVNIGNRQRGRPQADNILNSGYDSGSIAGAIRTALGDTAFRQRCAAAVNPYGDGRSSRRICETLRDIPLDRRLLDKECTY
ncbi:MAG: UDP-N-acetylglucosamine 2-epimerase [Sulfuritalea sp.]|nr:UDP-N-acetylglucosamine 2-epimerase [Sulfuritalea sp.]